VLPKSSLRVALLAAGLLVGISAFAGASSGSSSGPKASTPQLIAHDTSGFGGEVTPLHGAGRPQAHRAPKGRTRPTTRRLASGSTTLLTIASATSGTYATGDIGRTQYVQAVGSTYAVFSRVGTLLASVTDTTFWAGLGGPDDPGICATAPTQQPDVAYDRLADRWVIAEGAYDGTNYVQCFAVSTTGDATGTWYRYAYSVSSTLQPSMPSLAVWPDGYYLSFNEQGSGGWAGAGALVVQRTEMLVGASDAKARFFDLSSVSSDLGGMRVATIEGSNAPTTGAPALYLQAHDDPLNTNDRLDLWSFHVDWTGGSSTFSQLASVPIPAYATDSQDVAHTAAVPAPELTDELPQLGGQLEYYNDGSGHETLTVADTIVGGSPTSVGWYQLGNTNAAGWTLAQSGAYSPGLSVGVGDASAAAYDGTDIGLGYSTGTSFDYTNPNNAGVGDQQVGTSPVSQQSSLTLDPVETCDLWLTGPTIVAFEFSGCTASGTTVPVLTADPTVPRLAVEGTALTGTMPSPTFSGATSTTEQWERCDSSGLNCVVIANSASTSYAPVAADADGSHTLRFEETGTNAQGSSIAVSGPTEIVVSLPPSNTVLPAITGTLQSGQTLSAANGTWDSSSPTSFTYRWQRCSATCSDIPGATGSTYTLTTSDVGTTLDAVVSATNTGGGTSATSAQTGTIAAAASSGGSGGGSSGGGGGGGGGGSGKPDVALSVSASTTTPAVGSTMTLVYTVTDKNLAPATDLLVTLTLPSGVTYAGNYDPRGSGCTASSATTVVCNLAYVSSDTPATSVNVYLTIAATGSMTVAATATSDLGELSTTDNTASVTLNPASSTTTTTTSSTTGIPTGLNGNPKTTTKKTDKTPPTAHAVASIAHRGRVADLRFKIYDNSGEAKATATVKRKGKAIGKASTGFGPVAYGSVYYVGWKVPKKLAAGKYSFCVVAYDHANHHSRTSCAALTVH
jgi:hypothetical protein